MQYSLISPKLTHKQENIDKYIPFSKRAISFTNRISVYIYQLILSSFGDFRRSIFHLLTSLLFLAYIRQWISTHLFLLPILKFNYRIILSCHSLDNYHHIFLHTGHHPRAGSLIVNNVVLARQVDAIVDIWSSILPSPSASASSYLEEDWEDEK